MKTKESSEKMIQWFWYKQFNEKCKLNHCSNLMYKNGSKLRQDTCLTMVKYIT